MNNAILLLDVVGLVLLGCAAVAKPIRGIEAGWCGLLVIVFAHLILPALPL